MESSEIKQKILKVLMDAKEKSYDAPEVKYSIIAERIGVDEKTVRFYIDMLAEMKLVERPPAMMARITKLGILSFNEKKRCNTIMDRIKHGFHP